MDRDTHLTPSSPSNSSGSSSGLDTESTGSFFPDRSTTLGTLMGVAFPEAAARPARLPSRRDQSRGVAGFAAEDARRRPNPRAVERLRRRRHRGRRGWWRRLCGDGAERSTSLGEFLRVERTLAGGDVADGDYVFGSGAAAEHVEVGGGPLFEDGRVLPPAERRRQRMESVGRLPLLLITGICSGGEW